MHPLVYLYIYVHPPVCAIYYNAILYYLVHPTNCRCKGLIFLETFTDKLETLVLPDFLDISREVTGIKEYSMYHLAAHESARSQKGPQSNGIGTAKGNKEVTPSSLSPGLQ